jgi:hypothetical protein
VQSAMPEKEPSPYSPAAMREVALLYSVHALQELELRVIDTALTLQQKSNTCTAGAPQPVTVDGGHDRRFSAQP